MKLLIKNGGSLTGEATEQELKQVLSPEPGTPSSRAAPTIPFSSALSTKSPSDISNCLSMIQTLLVEGRRDDALEVAAANDLWAHALIISSLMIPAKYNETMANFVKTTMPEGSPMRMLLLLLAGRPQDAFGSTPSTSESRELSLMSSKWRENLVMILANRGSSRGSESAVLVALGDALREHPQLICASHLCYLLAAADSTSPLLEEIDPAARCVLVGVDHRQGDSFAQNIAAIQLSELFEFAKRQQRSTFSWPPLQIYKFIYAVRLAEVGLNSRAWKYVESIKEAINQQKGAYKYPRPFAHHFSEFAGRLEQIVAKTAPTTGKLEAASKSVLGLFGRALKSGIGAIIGDDEQDESAQQNGQKQQAKSQPGQPSAPNVITPPAIPFESKSKPAVAGPAPVGPQHQRPLPVASQGANVVSVVPLAANVSTPTAAPTSEPPSLSATPVAHQAPTISLSGFSTPVNTKTASRKTASRTTKRTSVAPVGVAGFVPSGRPSSEVSEVAPPAPQAVPLEPAPSTAPAPLLAAEAPAPATPVLKKGVDAPSADVFKVPGPAPVSKQTQAKSQQPTPKPAPAPAPPAPATPTAAKEESNDDEDDTDDEDEKFKTPAKTAPKAHKEPQQAAPTTPATPGRLGFLNPLNWFSRSAQKAPAPPKTAEKKAVEVKLGGKMTMYYNEELKMYVNRGEEEEARKKKAAMTAAPPTSKKVAAAAPSSPGDTPSTPLSVTTTGAPAVAGTPGPEASPTAASISVSSRASARISRTSGRGRKYVGQNNEIIETAKTPQHAATSAGPQPTPIPFPRMSGESGLITSPLVAVGSSPLTAAPPGGGMMPGAMSFDAFNAIAAARAAEAEREPEPDVRSPVGIDKKGEKKKSSSQDDDDGYNIFNSKPKKAHVVNTPPQEPKVSKRGQSKTNQTREDESEATRDPAAEDESDQIML